MAYPEPLATPLHAAARAYAERGWYVFPLHDVTAGACSCGRLCASPGKHPRTAHGLHESTRDLATVDRWWAQWPAANIGLDCGRSGIIGFDVDVKRGAQGRASLLWFLERYPQFAQTLCAGTPTGGLHYYFSGAPRDSTHSKIGPGLDVQSRGAYILLPPSIAFGQYDEAKRPVPGSQNLYHWLNGNPILPYPIADQQSGYDFSEKAAPANDAGAVDAVPYGAHRDALLKIAWSVRRNLALSENSTVELLKNFINGGLLENYDHKHPFSENDLRGMVRAVAPNISAPITTASSLLDAMISAEDVFKVKPVMRQVIIPNFIIGGELHLLYGADGSKKTTIAAYLLALISQQGNDVCAFISEDQPRDFLLKFLHSGGLRERIHFFDTSKFVGDFLLPKHRVALTEMMTKRAWGCVYFDSINDYKSTDVRLNAADEARQMYGPLQQLAQSSNTTILCTLHTNAKDVLEGARQIRAKARVVARVEKPQVDESEDGYDFSKAFDPDMSALVTTEKFSRGKSRSVTTFLFDVVPAIDPTTGECEYELQPDGTSLPKELLVCIEHELPQLAPGAKSVGRPRKITDEDLVMRITTILREKPNTSAREIYRQVGGTQAHVFASVREAKERMKHGL